MGVKVTTKVVKKRLAEDTVARALEFAKLNRQALKTGWSVDDGTECLYLEADIQQYSAFLVALAVQFRTADELDFLTGQVQSQYRADGDSKFWLPGLTIEG